LQELKDNIQREYLWLRHEELKDSIQREYLWLRHAGQCHDPHRKLLNGWSRRGIWRTVDAV